MHDEIEVESGRGYFAYLYAGLTVLVLGGVFVALAEYHHDELQVVSEEGVVSVQQGRYAPIGWETYRPTEAFKPVAIEADMPVRTGECADLADCEARLFEVVVEQARRFLRRRERLREASELIAQAVKLSSVQNRDTLLELQGDEQYVRGMLKLADAIAVMEEGRRAFFRARAMETRTFNDSASKLAAVDGILAELRQMQTAWGTTTRTPAPAPSVPVPQPLRKPSTPTPAPLPPPPAAETKPAPEPVTPPKPSLAEPLPPPPGMGTQL